jgi:exopolysaccharide production protein ExoZ
LTIESSRQDIASIQMLRGIAATMIVFVHLDVQLRRHALGGFDAGWLASGVDIFFVISGFIMWVTTARRVGISGGDFMKNRIVRIVPLYWMISFIVLAIALLAPQLLHTTVFDPLHTLASFLFLPARHPITGDFWPLLIPGWTLNFEMLFYVLFAISIAMSPGSPGRRILLISMFLFAVLLVAELLKTTIDFMNFYANPIILEFLAGSLLGVLYLSGRMRASWLWAAAVPTGFLLLWRGSDFVPHGLPYAGPAATLIVAGALFTPPFRMPLLQAIGDASYSLYLTHVIALAAIAALWKGYVRAGGALLFSTTCVCAALVVATLCYRFIELPVTAALKRTSVGGSARSRSDHASRAATASSTSEAAE